MRNNWLMLVALLAACGGGDAETTDQTAPPAAASVTGIDSASGAAATPAQAAPDSETIVPPTELVRETYSYSFTRASRDPFRGMTSVAVEEGPELLDLQLVSIIFNRSEPRLSLATFRDLGNKRQYYVRPGDRIGRLTVSSVESTEATLRVNDFGTIREHTYSLSRAEDGTR